MKITEIKQNQKGSAIPFVLMVLSILSLSMLMLVPMMANHIAGKEGKVDQLQAYYLAEGATIEALVLLDDHLEKQKDIRTTIFEQHKFMGEYHDRIKVRLKEYDDEYRLAVTARLGSVKSKRETHLVYREESWTPMTEAAPLTIWKGDNYGLNQWVNYNRNKNMVIEVAQKEVVSLKGVYDGYLHIKSPSGMTLKGEFDAPEIVIESNTQTEAAVDVTRMVVDGDLTIASGKIRGQEIYVTGDLHIGQGAIVEGNITVEGTIEDLRDSQPNTIINGSVEPLGRQRHLYVKGVVTSFQVIGDE